jgi:hypothetical protein
MSGARSLYTAQTVAGCEQPPARMSHKPPGAAKGFFDGAWWPRSAEPVTEFSALVSAVAGRLGAVDRIGYNPTAWDLAPDVLMVAGHPVRLHGFHGLNPFTVVLIGPIVHRLTLLVIPAATPQPTAAAALALAADPDNVDDAARIFAGSGATTDPSAHPGTG